MTASEFLPLPVTNLLHELLDGEEIMSPSPTIDHQRLLFRIAQYLTRIIPNGEVFVAVLDARFDDYNVVQPDIMWVAAGSACVSVEGKYVKSAPDLV